MVPWKPSFYLRPLVNKGNFVYFLLRRRAIGHIRPASACWSTTPSPKDPLEPGSGWFVCPTPCEVTTPLCVHKTQVEKVLANCSWYQRDDSWDHFWESHIVFHVYFVDLSLPLLLFRFSRVFIWIIFCILLAQAQLPYTGLSVLILGSITLFFFNITTLWVLMQQYPAGCKYSWLHGVDLGAGRNYK